MGSDIQLQYARIESVLSQADGECNSNSDTNMASVVRPKRKYMPKKGMRKAMAVMRHKALHEPAKAVNNRPPKNMKSPTVVNTKSMAPETSAASRSPYVSDATVASDDGENSEAADWYWEPKLGGYWVHATNERVRSETTGNKRVRGKSMTNKLKRRWVVGMRRNWNIAKKHTMVACCSLESWGLWHPR